MKKLLLSSALFAATLLVADTSYSPPVGGIAYTIAGGTVSVPTTTAFAIPLLDVPAASGAAVGRIAAMTATTLTVTGANWVAGALATAQFPYAVRMTSGAAAGYTFSITGNTTDTLTVSGGDPTQLGVVVGGSGDSFRLLPIDTLNTLFGSNTFLGGTSPAVSDIVILSSTLQLAYYYNSTLSRWVRTTGPTTDRGNIPIPLDSMISVIRKSSALTLSFFGPVPRERFAQVVPNAGSTYTHTGFPTDVTLGSLSLQTALPGWVSSSAAANADLLSVSGGAGFTRYFYNGTNWQRTTGPTTNRDTITISAGTPIQIFKRGSAAGSALFVRTLPYTL